MKKLGTILISVSVLLTLLVPMFVVPASAATTKVPSYYRAVDWDTRYALGDNPHDYNGFSQNGTTNVIIDTPEGYKMRTSWDLDGGYGPIIHFEKPNNEATGLGANFDYASFEGVMIRMTVPPTGQSSVGYDYGFAPILHDAGSNDIRFSTSHFGDPFALPGETHVYLYDYATGKEVKNVQTHTAGKLWDTLYVPYNNGNGFDGWVFFPKEFFVTEGPVVHNVDGATIYGVSLRLRGMNLAESPCIVEFGDIDLVYNKDAYVKEVIASNYPAPEIDNGYYTAQDFSGYTEPDNTIESANVSAIVTDTDGGKALQVTKPAISSHFVGFPVQTPKQASGLDATPRAVAIKVNSPETNGRYKYATFAAANSYDDMQTNEKTFLCSYQSDLSRWGANNTKDVTFYQVSDAGVKRTVEMKAGTTYAWHHTLLSTSDTSDQSDAFSGWIVMPVEGFKDGFDVMSMGYARFHVLYHENVPYTISEVGYVYDLDKFIDSFAAPETSEPIDNESAGILDMEALPNDKQGLRFTHTLETVNTGNGNVYVADGETYTVKTIGSLVAVADYLETSGKALTLGAAATDKKIMSAAAESYRSVVKDGDKRTYKFTSLIKNIGKANKAVDVSARAFVICEDAEGNEKIFYGPVITKNVQQVYDAAVAGGHEFNAAVDSWMA